MVQGGFRCGGLYEVDDEGGLNSAASTVTEFNSTPLKDSILFFLAPAAEFGNS